MYMYKEGKGALFPKPTTHDRMEKACKQQKSMSNPFILPDPVRSTTPMDEVFTATNFFAYPRLYKARIRHHGSGVLPTVGVLGC